jgi:hypothetical protein
LLFLLLLVSTDVRGQGFDVLGFGVTAQGNFAVSHVSDTSSYYVLYRGQDLISIHQVAAVSLGRGATAQLTDPTPVSISSQGYYRLRQVPRSETVDIDGDGVPWPGDPSALASAVHPGAVTSMADATQFLYSGPNPSQVGVASGVFDGQRVCVLRGKAMQRDGSVIAGVLISVLGHPEFGRTKTRADGVFDFAVNGGARLTVKFERLGYVPLQRPIVAPWGDYACLPDVVLIGADRAGTAVTLGTNTPLQVARGSVQSDGDGSRRATIILPAGTCAKGVTSLGPAVAITGPTVSSTVDTPTPTLTGTASGAGATERAKKLYFQAAREQTAPYKDRWRLFKQGEVFPGVTAIPRPGHTPGHTTFMVSSGKEQLLIWGDTVHVPEVQTARPEVCMEFDTDAEGAAASRRQVFDMVATDRLLVTGMHLHFPGFAHLVRRGTGYQLITAAWEQVV